MKGLAKIILGIVAASYVGIATAQPLTQPAQLNKNNIVEEYNNGDFWAAEFGYCDNPEKLEVMLVRVFRNDEEKPYIQATYRVWFLDNNEVNDYERELNPFSYFDGKNIYVDRNRNGIVERVRENVSDANPCPDMPRAEK